MLSKAIEVHLAERATNARSRKFVFQVYIASAHESETTGAHKHRPLAVEFQAKGDAS
jgi:hypothetical protein